jgi:hypothetical protein
LNELENDVECKQKIVVRLKKRMSPDFHIGSVVGQIAITPESDGRSSSLAAALLVVPSQRPEHAMYND